MQVKVDSLEDERIWLVPWIMYGLRGRLMSLCL